MSTMIVVIDIPTMHWKWTKSLATEQPRLMLAPRFNISTFPVALVLKTEKKDSSLEIVDLVGSGWYCSVGVELGGNKVKVLGVLPEHLGQCKEKLHLLVIDDGLVRTMQVSFK
jgi:hypothetical protein